MRLTPDGFHGGPVDPPGGGEHDSPTHGSESLAYCGAHFRLCPVEVREVWARALQDDESLRTMSRKLAAGQAGPVEVVVISTCNRFDVCLAGRFTAASLVAAFSRMAQEYLQASGEWNRTWEHLLSPTALAPALRIAFDDEAAALLFRVSASLDSLVLGEPHILGQVKSAFARARRLELTGPGLTPFFARAFQVAKRVRTETDLGQGGISIGHAAVEIARRVYENLREHKVLVVGAGEMARIVAQHFLACGVVNITLANRTSANAATLASQLAAPGATLAVRDLDAALGAVGEHDIVVIATAAPRYLLERKTVERSLRKRGGRPLVLVDISVPRNVNPDVAEASGVFVFDVDDLDQVMEHNRSARREAADRAEDIVKAEAEAFSHERRQRESLRAVGRFHAWARAAVLAELTRRVKNDAGIPLARAEVLADAIAKRFVARGAKLAREEASLPPLENVGDALELLFSLDEIPQLPDASTSTESHGRSRSLAHSKTDATARAVGASVIPFHKESKTP